MLWFYPMLAQGFSTALPPDSSRVLVLSWPWVTLWVEWCMFPWVHISRFIHPGHYMQKGYVCSLHHHPSNTQNCPFTNHEIAPLTSFLDPYLLYTSSFPGTKVTKSIHRKPWTWGIQTTHPKQLQPLTTFLRYLRNIWATTTHPTPKAVKWISPNIRQVPRVLDEH